MTRKYAPPPLFIPLSWCILWVCKLLQAFGYLLKK